MPTKVASAPEADPFDSSTPTLETQDERNARIAREAHEKSVSDRIDEEIEKQRQLEKKTAKPIKLLLLGSSSSAPLLLLAAVLTTPRSQARVNRVGFTKDLLDNVVANFPGFQENPPP